MLNSYTEIKFQDNHCVLLILLISLNKVGWLNGFWCIHFHDLPHSLNETNFCNPLKIVFMKEERDSTPVFISIYKSLYSLKNTPVFQIFWLIMHLYPCFN